MIICSIDNFKKERSQKSENNQKSPLHRRKTTVPAVTGVPRSRLASNSTNSDIFERYMLSSISPRNLSLEQYQIYYLFAFSSVGRQLIPFLRTLGLNCTEPKNNPAQGTVSTLIFFENVYLEVFWVEKTSYFAQFDMITGFNFLARVNWLATGASPFGFGLSYATTNHNNFADSAVEAIPKDRASISEQLLRFCPINLANPEEPICYVVPDYMATQNRLDRASEISEQIMYSSLEIRKLTHVKFRVISDQVITPPLIDLAAQKLLDIEYGKLPLLELIFDDGNQTRLIDLRPLIPIVLRY